MDKLYVAMLRVARKRADLYGMELPHLGELEAEARAEADRMEQEQPGKSQKQG